MLAAAWGLGRHPSRADSLHPGVGHDLRSAAENSVLAYACEAVAAVVVAGGLKLDVREQDALLFAIEGPVLARLASVIRHIEQRGAQVDRIGEKKSRGDGGADALSVLGAQHAQYVVVHADEPNCKGRSVREKVHREGVGAPGINALQDLPGQDFDRVVIARQDVLLECTLLEGFASPTLLRPPFSIGKNPMRWVVSTHP
jgi:hypothetical protein